MQKGCAGAYEPFNMNIYDGVRFLLVQVMDDLVMSGRANRIHDLSAVQPYRPIAVPAIARANSRLQSLRRMGGLALRHQVPRAACHHLEIQGHPAALILSWGLDTQTKFFQFGVRNVISLAPGGSCDHAARALFRNRHFIPCHVCWIVCKLGRKTSRISSNWH